MEWKTTLRNAALHGGELDVETIKRDDCCALGKWLHGDGARQWRREAKFVDLAEGILPRAQTDRLMRLCWGIADAPDAGAVALAVSLPTLVVIVSPLLGAGLKAGRL